MSDPYEPQFSPPPPLPAQPGPAAGRPTLAARIGPRLGYRPAPRLGVSFAGIGIGLAVLGVVVWAGDYLVSGISVSSGGGASDSRRLLGIGLSLVVIAAGYLLAVTRRGEPLATAGVVASALGVPVLFGFLTFDSGSSSGLPLSLDAVVLVSVATWMISYLFVAGCRGHAFYLGLASVALWLYVVDKATPDALSPLSIVGRVVPISLGQSSKPDLTTIAGLSLTFGLAYYLISYVLDRARMPGPGAPLAVSGFLATAVGIAAAAPSLHAIGTGVLLILLGTVLAGYGARSGRRFTTWVWSAGVAIGVIVIIAKAFPNNNAAAGITLIISGVAVVVIGQLLAGALNEAKDVPPT